MALKTLRAIKQQADLMKAQADHMGEQTAILQDSVAAAKKSADAAESSAIAAMGVAVPALLLEEFAFIPMVGVALETSLQFPRMAISVRNYGQSPAILRSFAVEFSCGNPPLDFRCKDILCFDSGTAVESGKVKDLEEGGVTSSKAFSTEDVSDIMNGKKFLTAYGSVWYDDVFGSPTHELRFCKWAVSAWPDDQQLRWIDCDLLARYEAENQKAK
jgi:hypothetical protein